MSRSINLIAVDGERLFLDSIVMCLEREASFKVKKGFAKGLEVLPYLEDNSVDIALIDSRLPDTDGIALIQKIRKKHPKIKVVMLTADRDPFSILKAVDAGVSGVQLKSCSLKDLIQSLGIVSSDQKYYAPEVLKMIATRPSKKGRNQLSRREVEIMQMLAEGLSAREIGERLLISARTVETHKANIMRKLNVKKATHLVKIAYDQGMVKVKTA